MKVTYELEVRKNVIRRDLLSTHGISFTKDFYAVFETDDTFGILFDWNSALIFTVNSSEHYIGALSELMYDPSFKSYDLTDVVHVRRVLNKINTIQDF